ncbi:unnamed protein product [Arabis nemorensis]|uniref:Uncharacterized protein n=1 Tax=Arabis nemorensis TaxID=586526 RepID=A0A565CHR4_9BRAS|nr:unnamed protein product [Arabis nemorensis]
MAMEITQFLVTAMSADEGVRTGAEGRLRHSKSRTYLSFFYHSSLSSPTTINLLSHAD